jgi:hypothetical protein
MNKDKPQWAPLSGARERDDDGTKRMPVVSREELIKQSEPSTGLIGHEELLRLQAHTRLPESAALDPLDDDLPVVSPVQPPPAIIPARLVPPPAPTEVPPPLATSLLSQTLLQEIQMHDELEHGGKNFLPVLASRLPQLESMLKGSGHVATGPVAAPQAPEPVKVSVQEQREVQDAAPPAAGLPAHDTIPRSAHIGLEQLRALHAQPKPEPTKASAWIWMVLATIFGMVLMALWLGRL